MFKFPLQLLISSQATPTAYRYLSCNTFKSFPSSKACPRRAVIYSQNGDPASVLQVMSVPPLPPTPPPNSVNIRFLLSPVNPADINVIEGVYPTGNDAITVEGKENEGTTVYVGGNEGLAQVTAIGSGVSSPRVGDWVVMVKQQSGTWISEKNIAAVDVAKVPTPDKLTEVQAATLTVNPATAYNMLSDFVALQEGDWVLQNGANSAVGQAVIQIATARKLKTINFVRNRENLDHLKAQLTRIGATRIVTYDDLADKSLRQKIETWTGGKNIRLGLNCVGGKETTLMSKLLGQDAHLVSYGAMSKQPLSLPTPLFIFKNLTAHGFWQSRWYKNTSLEHREILMRTLIGYIADKKLDTPDHEIHTISSADSDETAGQKIRKLMSKLSAGRYGKKILIKIL